MAVLAEALATPGGKAKPHRRARDRAACAGDAEDDLVSDESMGSTTCHYFGIPEDI